MDKKPTKPDQSTETLAAAALGNDAPPDSADTTSAPAIDLSKPFIQQAISQGKALIAEGKSKADAARAIFTAIADEPKEVIVAAFVEGATLTEKGALTYWYNCRRKASKAT